MQTTIQAPVFTLTHDERACLDARLVIKSAQLSAIEHLHLKLFLNRAVKSPVAARFILSRTSLAGPGNSVEDILRSIKEDLQSLALKFSHEVTVSSSVDKALREREKYRCCISKHGDRLEATYVVSPSILNDKDLQPGGTLRPLLDAAVTPELADKLFLFLQSCETQNEELKNLWLMSPLVRSAFRGGHIVMSSNEVGGSTYWRVRKQTPGNFSVPGVSDSDFFTTIYKVLAAQTENRPPLPEPFLLKIHSTISASLHYMTIERQINNGWQPTAEADWKIGRTGQRFLQCLFLVLPAILRLWVFKLILKLMDRWDPQKDSSFKYLPFGLCLKLGQRASKNEANALLLVEKYTSIPAPRLIAFAQDGRNNGYLLMTRVPGVPMDSVFYRMTYEERSQVAKDLGKYISQYRCIRNTNKYLICDTLGGPTMDHRTKTRRPCGPYESKREFLDFLTEKLKDARHTFPVSVLYERKHDICFTHSDLHLSNIFVQNGRLSGLIDWEHACFKPEYWDYTRVMWAYKSDDQLEKEFSLAFDKSYKDELEAERLIWEIDPIF
ncbi:hypothetical protein D8B26_005551 [Coccidioides posadasii str. Silveira]|uniref:uncharacterized protein n=1 Tax=Coccidioides posadasii (strain RMSCC 757 / Silveira) TaxID=443226 RepID=UPI001BEEC2E6|nr:hypothetical protein D8B26_005551 [Coccidioides posadasii str. Silveira]